MNCLNRRQKPSTKMLGEIETNLTRFSDVLTRTYLVHSGVPQQITELPVHAH